MPNINASSKYMITIIPPQLLFKTHLITQIKEWIEEGDQVVLCIDANESLQSGPLEKQLSQLGIQDTYNKRHATKGPATWFR